MKKSLRFVALLCFIPLCSLHARTGTGEKAKDCWGFTVLHDGKGYRTDPKADKKILSEKSKLECTQDGKGTPKDMYCDSIKMNCKPSNNFVVGGYVRWGTSRTNCPTKCPGYETVSPKDVIPYE